MTDLNTRLPSGSGWVLESANDVNDVGEIAGVGTINGQRHAFLLTLPVRLRVFNVGIFDDDSNLPRGGVQVGRPVTFVTSVSLLDDVTAHRVVLTDAISGPVTIESVRTAQGSACSVAGDVVTCRIPQFGELQQFRRPRRARRHGARERSRSLFACGARDRRQRRAESGGHRE